ncbi:hypothetical protein FOA52_011343, partial [Chlamydomonas sp. UWO 241]
MDCDQFVPQQEQQQQQSAIKFAAPEEDGAIIETGELASGSHAQTSTSLNPLWLATGCTTSVAFQSQSGPTDDTDSSKLLSATLDKITKLMQAFAGVKAERSTSLLLRRLLDLILSDVAATFACVQAFAPDGSMSLLVASVGSPEWSDKNRVQLLGKDGARQAAEVIWGDRKFLEWSAADGDDSILRLPADWQLLLATMPQLTRISAAPIFIADELAGVLTIATNSSVPAPGSFVVWRSYMHLLAANIATRLKDSAIPQHLDLVRGVRAATDIDSVVHSLTVNMRGVLGNSSHMWYRMALTCTRGDVVTIFDDISQLPAAHSGPMGSNMSRVSSSASAMLTSNTSEPLSHQMCSMVVRSVVRTKNTVMDIAIRNRQQVVVPDVQKLINQSGKVSVDIFNTRLVKPPTSVLVFPLKHRSTIFGALFCMSTVATDFTDLGHTVRELCEVMSPQLLFALRGTCKEEYQLILNAKPDGITMSNSGHSSGGVGLATLGSDALCMDSN